MTDDNVRAASNPTDQPETEPAPAGDAEAVDAPHSEAPSEATSADETVEVAPEAENEVIASAEVEVERAGEPVAAIAAEEDATVVEEAAAEELAPDAMRELEAADVAEVEAAPETAGTVAEAEPEIEEPPATAADDETVTEPGVDAPIGDQRSDAFIWHPDHRGKTVDEVRQGLAQEIASDQRQHRLALDGAEESEQDALASVVNLERKWGPYDFDWAEQDPEMLAARITEFEQERERQQKMLSWEEYRTAGMEHDEAREPGERPAELSTGTKALSLVLVVMLIVIILLAVWAL